MPKKYTYDLCQWELNNEGVPEKEALKNGGRVAGKYYGDFLRRNDMQLFKEIYEIRKDKFNKANKGN